MKVQSNNRRTTNLLTVNGETHSYAEWADITGVPLYKIQQRIKYGWPPEDVISPDNFRLKKHSEQHNVKRVI